MASTHLATVFVNEYYNDVKNLSSGIKPPAGLAAMEKISEVLDILGFPEGGKALPRAWTFRSKGIRFFECDGSVLLNQAGKPLTMGRRCAMYVRLPVAVPCLNLQKDSFVGVVGDVSTQSTNVPASVYFIVVPRTEKIWAIIGVLDSVHRTIVTSRDSVVSFIEAAKARSLRLKKARQERSEARAGDESHAARVVSASRTARKHAEKSADESVQSSSQQMSSAAPSGNAVPAPVFSEEQKSDLIVSDKDVTTPYYPVDQQLPGGSSESVFSPVGEDDNAQAFAPLSFWEFPDDSQSFEPSVPPFGDSDYFPDSDAPFTYEPLF